MSIDFTGYDDIRDLKSTDFSDINITLFVNPHTPGGIEDTAAQIDLPGALLSSWEDDFHFSQYTATPVYRYRKDFDFPKDWKCSVLVYDWDRHGRDLDQETWSAFILTNLHVIDKPNIVYPTRHGARSIYILNQPLTTGEEFEAKYRGLLKKLIQGNNNLITIDEKTWDWTRLFRLPRVVRDGVPEYERPIFHVHENRLDINTLKAYVPPKQKKGEVFIVGTPSTKYKSDALYWIRNRAPHSVSGDNGHGTLFHIVVQLMTRFQLSSEDTRILLDVYNERKCEPTWSERELDHKVNDVQRRLLRGARCEQANN